MEASKRKDTSTGSSESKGRSRRAEGSQRAMGEQYIRPLYPGQHRWGLHSDLYSQFQADNHHGGKLTTMKRGLHPARVWTEILIGQSPGLEGQAFSKLKAAISVPP